ncbi:MAG: FAD:protein FMN transferase, partial [Desulfobacterales bacterium]|nr:FAD:protein FMN transferase [Desulfobacterales bacterium]
MPFEQSIELIDVETVLAECGPMRLSIRAWKDNRPQQELSRQAAEESFAYLEAVAKHQAVLSDFAENIKALPENDLAQRMIQSVRAIGDIDLTPMAAVAGTIADAVADWLFIRGSTKVVVDNGGDIAIRLTANETAAVGIRPRITHLDISHVVNLDDRQPSWGVTTSGRGGRSFTRGIASAVTVIADNASIADAAATSIANACFVEDDSIVQIPAEQMDLNTDLKGVNVTVDVGLLSPGKKIQAVQTALS